MRYYRGIKKLGSICWGLLPDRCLFYGAVHLWRNLPADPTSSLTRVRLYSIHTQAQPCIISDVTASFQSDIVYTLDTLRTDRAVSSRQDGLYSWPRDRLDTTVCGVGPVAMVMSDGNSATRLFELQKIHAVATAGF
jgi:hypothetical protein